MSSWWWGLHPWFHLVVFFGSEGPPSPSTEIRPPRTRTSRGSSMMLVMTWMQHSKWLSPGRSWWGRAFFDKKAPKVPSECCFLSQIHQIIPRFGGGEINRFKQMCWKVIVGKTWTLGKWDMQELTFSKSSKTSGGALGANLSSRFLKNSAINPLAASLA